MAIEAVLFDFHGVLTTSPFSAMSTIGANSGVDPQVVLEVMLGDYAGDTDHGWHRLERGEITFADYLPELMARAAAAGFEVDWSGLRQFSEEMRIHQEVVDAIADLRARGYRTAVVTNNVKEFGDRWRSLVPLDDLFDAVVDSCHVGMRKPNPKIYLHTLDLLGGIPPDRAVFLDDAPGNVEGARTAGLHAIFVEDPAAALDELHALLDGAQA